MRRETSRVSFLMCPFCVRAPSSIRATAQDLATRTAPTKFADLVAAIRPVEAVERIAWETVSTVSNSFHTPVMVERVGDLS